MSEQLDDIQELEARPETAHVVPTGWRLLYWGLILFGVYYTWRYTPGLGGWSQSQDLEGGGAGTGANVFATIAFTAIPAAAALWLVLAQRSKRKGPAGR